jgi:hypothetical protein
MELVFSSQSKKEVRWERRVESGVERKEGRKDERRAVCRLPDPLLF